MSVFDLSPTEKLQLIQDLWDDLAADPSQVPVHDWQCEELDLRHARLESGISWEEVQARVRGRRHP